MKRISYLIILIIGTLLNSCLDLLDVAPDGNLTMEDVWADPNKTAALVSACYDELPAFGWMFEAWDNIFTSCTDDAYASHDFTATFTGLMYRGQSSAEFHYLGNVMTYQPSSNNGGYWWNRYWQQIRKCMQIIEEIDKSVATETNKRRYKAEVRVLKAWFYLELIKFYGKLPILDTTVAYDADFSTLKRETVYDIVTKCIAPDCDAALATEELPWRIDNADNAQRTTKALAHAIKGTAYLYAASPLHNEGNDYWEVAYQVLGTAVSELKKHGYELFSKCTDPDRYGTGDEAAWYQYVSSEMDFPQNRDKETIWQKKAIEYDGTWYARYSYFFCYIGNGLDGATTSCCPTQELVDAFETRDGEPILDLRQPYLDERHLQPNFRPGTGYSDLNPYVNRDPRFYATVLKNNDIIPWSFGLPLTVESYVGGAHAINFDISVVNATRTGYFHRKMVVPGSSPTLAFNYPTHKYYRLAEILLSYAEAAAEAGHLSEAKTAADEVRARVKMPPLPAGLSQEDLILRIRNERRVELAYENQRYFDLRRWQRPDGNIEFQYKWATGMLIRKQPNGSFTYERVNTASEPRYNYETKDLLLPIPLTEASLLESVTGEKWQNPGW